MRAETVDEQGPTTESRAHVRLANGPLTGPVLCRVVSMMLTRAEWPVDRLDDAMLVCDALCAHAPAHASDGRLTFSIETHGEAIEVRVQELSAEGAAGLVRDAMLPGVGNVLERVADSLSIEPAEQGMGSQLVLVLTRAG